MTTPSALAVARTGLWTLLAAHLVTVSTTAASRCWYWRCELPYTAKALGLTIPQSVLVRADEVIE